MENRIAADFDGSYSSGPVMGPEDALLFRASGKSKRKLNTKVTESVRDPYIAAIYRKGSARYCLPMGEGISVDSDFSGKNPISSAIYQGLPASFVWQLTSNSKEVLAAERAGQEVLYCSEVDELLESVRQKYLGYRFLDIRAEHSSVVCKILFKTESNAPKEILALAQEFSKHWLQISNSAVRALHKKQSLRWDQEYYLFRSTYWDQDGNHRLNFLIHNPEKAKQLLVEKKKCAKQAKAEIAKGDYPQIGTLFQILRSAIANHLMCPLTPKSLAEWHAKPGKGAQLIHPERGYLDKNKIPEISCRLYEAISLLKIDLVAREDYQNLLKKIQPYLAGMKKASEDKKALALYLEKDLEKIDV